MMFITLREKWLRKRSQRGSPPKKETELKRVGFARVFLNRIGVALLDFELILLHEGTPSNVSNPPPPPKKKKPILIEV